MAACTFCSSAFYLQSHYTRDSKLYARVGTKLDIEIPVRCGEEVVLGKRKSSSF